MIKVLLFLTFPLWGLKIEATQVRSTTFIQDNTPSYLIKASKYIQNFNPKKFILLLFNQEQYMLQNNFYQNGVFKVAQLKITFKKAYKFASKLYFFQLQGKYEEAIIKANKAIYYKHKLILKDCTIITPKKILRRKKYILYIK